MQFLKMAVFLLAIKIVSNDKIRKETKSRILSNFPLESIKVIISDQCFIEINIEKLKCMSDACSKYTCDEKDENICRGLWYTMDCITGLVDMKCSAIDQQSIRDQYSVKQKEMETTVCKDYLRNSSLNKWQNSIIVLNSLISVFVFKMTNL
jgi:hypothetical protein